MGVTPDQITRYTVGETPIGLFAATAQNPSTTAAFFCWFVEEEERDGKVEVGNIVAAVSDTEITFGVIQELSVVSDAPSIQDSFLSYAFGDLTRPSLSDPVFTMYAKVGVLRNMRGLERPVTRARVFLASAAGVAFALGMAEDQTAGRIAEGQIPLGVLKNTEDIVVPVTIDQHYVLGHLGAHLNICGMSGFASKTSGFLVFLKSVFTHTTVPTAAVVINNKHADLLALDHDNPELTEADRAFYRTIDVPCTPFERVRYFGPLDKHKNVARTARQDPTGRNDAEPFSWELEDILDFAHPQSSPFLELFDENCNDDASRSLILDLIAEIDPSNVNGQLVGYRTFAQLIQGMGGMDTLSAHHKATFGKIRRRISGMPNLYSGLVGGGVRRPIPFDDIRAGEVYVLDVAQMGAADDRAQRFILSQTIAALRAVVKTNKAAPAPGRPRAIVVFIDELNKHCPSRGEATPLKTQILDLYRQGRSAGLIAGGAEQLMSQVDPQAIANVGTFLFGRCDNAELRDGLYSEFPDAFKDKIRHLAQGHRMVKHIGFPEPIFIETGRPTCRSGDLADAPAGAAGAPDAGAAEPPRRRTAVAADLLDEVFG